MTTNRLLERPQHYAGDPQSRCDKLNAERLTEMQGRYYYVKRQDQRVNGENRTVESIEWMELPQGTKGWIRENEARVKGLIRKITGGDTWLIDDVYRRAYEAAPKPIPWSTIPVK